VRGVAAAAACAGWLAFAAVPAPATTASPVNDQGSNSNYRSNITAVTPAAPGLSVQVLEFADRLQLTNHTGHTVTIYGYQQEPYARVLANGTAEKNVRSPATYLNESFYGDIAVPATADPAAAPQWQVVDRTGSFEWHDHRIHWASPTLPPEVKDKSRRALIFNWTVPISVAAQRGAIAGQLFWQPESSSAPLAAIISGIAVVLLGIAFVVFVRRRRARERRGASATDPPDAADGSSRRAGGEAW